MSFDKEALDRWLTEEPDWRSGPIFHSYELIKEAVSYATYDEPYPPYDLAFNNFDELRCRDCKKPVGFLLHDDHIPATDSITEFWQIDEDGEELLCEGCYEKIIEEIGE
jgi:hypothetical protein